MRRAPRAGSGEYREEPREGRIVTKDQLKAGYMTLASGGLMRHAYDVLWENRDGTFTVAEPVAAVPAESDEAAP